MELLFYVTLNFSHCFIHLMDRSQHLLTLLMPQLGLMIELLSNLEESNADINFTLGDYEEDMKQVHNLSKEEFVHILRRQSTGFSRGTSKYRGVTLHKCGRWEARMGQFLGKK